MRKNPLGRSYRIRWIDAHTRAAMEEHADADGVVAAVTRINGHALGGLIVVKETQDEAGAIGGVESPDRSRLGAPTGPGRSTGSGRRAGS